MSRVSFIRNLQIKIKKGVVSPPIGYAAVIRVGVPHDPPRKSSRIETVESPILEYAESFAKKHKEIGYLSDGRLSQDAYNFAGLKLSYLKKGLNETQADIQAKRDVVKNLEIRSMELDLIQNQALKIGIPSFQPKTHLEHIEALSKKISDRKNEYHYIEKRENLEGALSIKFQYSDMSPLTFSQVSMFSPLEYFTFVKEHPEYHNVLLQPIRKDEERIVPEELKKKGGENNEDDAGENNDDDDDQKSKGGSSSQVGGSLDFSLKDYYLNNNNLYFNTSLPIELKQLPGLNTAHINNEGEMVEVNDPKKVLNIHLNNYNEGGLSYYKSGGANASNYNDRDLKAVKPDDYKDEDGIDESEEEDDEEDYEFKNYEENLDETKLGRDDICIDLIDLKKVPEKIERSKLLEDKLKKNFYSKDSLSQSKINLDQGRFVYEDTAFPSAADISLSKFARLPTVSAIKTLRHLLSSGSISKELLEYLERQEGGENEKQTSSSSSKESAITIESNLNKSYILSDLSNIETLSHLQRYNEIPESDRVNSVETDIKEAYVNTVLGVTDKLYTSPINEQRVLKKKFGNEFVFEETEGDGQLLDPLSQLDSVSKETKSKINKQHLNKGPIIEEDGLIDLRNTNIYSQHGLYESFVTNKYINKLETQLEKQQEKQSSLLSKDAQDNQINFQDVLSKEAFDIAYGKSSMNPLYLIEANNNRGSLLFNNKKQQQQEEQLVQQQEEITKEPTRSPTSFHRFYEKYVLPNNINDYAEYYGEDIIKREDAIRSKLVLSKLKEIENENKESPLFNVLKKIKTSSLVFDGPTNEKLNQLFDQYDDAADEKYKQLQIKLEIIDLLEKRSGETTKDRYRRHIELYPEYHTNEQSLLKKQSSESLLKDFIDLSTTNQQFNSINFNDNQQEDKVDFRTLKLDLETEIKFAKEIKQFREKDSKGEITLQDAYEFTNYINYLKQSSKSSPVIQSLKNSLFLKSTNNEKIDQFNNEALEQDFIDSHSEISKEELTFKLLEDMFPDQAERESAINILLSGKSHFKKLQDIQNQIDTVDQDLISKLTSSKKLKNNATLADVKVDLFQEQQSTRKNKFDIDFNDIDINKI